jgi:hypothetical protein
MKLVQLKPGNWIDPKFIMRITVVLPITEGPHKGSPARVLVIFHPRSQIADILVDSGSLEDMTKLADTLARKVIEAHPNANT